MENQLNSETINMPYYLRIISMFGFTLMAIMHNRQTIIDGLKHKSLPSYEELIHLLVEVGMFAIAGYHIDQLLNFLNEANNNVEELIR